MKKTNTAKPTKTTRVTRVSKQQAGTPPWVMLTLALVVSVVAYELVMFVQTMSAKKAEIQFGQQTVQQLQNN